MALGQRNKSNVVKGQGFEMLKSQWPYSRKIRLAEHKGKQIYYGAKFIPYGGNRATTSS